MKESILSIRDLTVKFRLRGRTLTALRGLSMDVYKGETLAIVGESGCGKTVLMKAVMGLLDRNGYIESGSIRYSGHELTTIKRNRDFLWLRGGEIAMVMQDPLTSLNPLKTVGEQVAESVQLHTTLTQDEARREATRLLETVGIKHAQTRRRQYPHEFSGGQRQRVVIAAALACKPKILVCDEPTTALDVTIQAQILSLIKKLKHDYGLTVIFITHDLGVVANMADRVAVMYAGDIVEYGTAEEIFYDARHPYTWALLSSLPQLAQSGEELYTLRGTPPNLFFDIRGDAFAPRNPRALNIDYTEPPPLFHITETHAAKTWLLDDRAPKVAPPVSLRIIRNGGARLVR